MILLQSIHRFMTTTADMLINHAITDGAPDVERAATAVADAGREYPVYAELATIAGGGAPTRGTESNNGRRPCSGRR